MQTRIDYLKSLEAGWNNGEGLPLSQSGLDWLDDNLSHLGFQVYIFPTLCGNVLLEWDNARVPSVFIDLSTRLASVTWLDSGELLEHTRTLNSVEDWEGLSNFLSPDLAPLFAKLERGSKELISHTKDLSSQRQKLHEAIENLAVSQEGIVIKDNVVTFNSPKKLN